MRVKIRQGRPMGRNYPWKGKRKRKEKFMRVKISKGGPMGCCFTIVLRSWSLQEFSYRGYYFGWHVSFLGNMMLLRQNFSTVKCSLVQTAS